MKKISYLFFLFLFAVASISATPYEIDLSGGTGGGYGESAYYAPNGTVVTASIGAYAYSNWYQLRNMFDNSFGNYGDGYWLPNTSSTTTLLINLDKLYYLSQIRVFVSTVYSHHVTQYKMEVSADGVNYTNITGGYLYAGTYNDTYWNINSMVDYVRFTVQTTSSWMCINEIELFSVVPEPASIAYLCIAGLLFFLKSGKKKIA
ncbi:MAG: discoidin domain-containing protein [Candidatus Brocadiae bacterium]|nr:discoidin domain-containing protein [Candidatus Brocadiia bacterium]